MDLAQVPFIFTNRRARLIDFYSLRELEDGAVPLYVYPPSPVEISETPSFTNHVQRWELRPHPRGIGLEWQPRNAIHTTDYTLQSSLPHDLPYTNEQYQQLVEPISTTDWTRLETDYLFKLCSRYHQRLLLVHTHYQYPGVTRSLEDIRERYWQVRQVLHSTTVETSPHQPTAYNKEADRHQRMLREALEKRSTEEKEETAILEELMVNMRLALPQILPRRERLLLLSGGMGQHLLAHAPTLPELCSSEGPVNGGRSSTAMTGTGRKDGSHAIGSSSPSTGHRKKTHARPSAVATASNANNKQNNKKKKTSRSLGETSSPLASDEIEDEPYDHAIKDTRSGNTSSRRSGITSTTATATISRIGVGLGPGRKPKPTLAHTFCRSQSLRPIRVGLTRHVDKLLLELGLPLRPNMPTLAVCERFDELRLLLARWGEEQKGSSIIGFGNIVPSNSIGANASLSAGTLSVSPATSASGNTSRTSVSVASTTSSRKASRPPSPGPSSSNVSTTERPLKRARGTK